MVYLLQGAVVRLVSLPVQPAQYAPRPLSAPAWAGAALRAGGLGFEAVGDRQPARFKAEPADRGRIMGRGLWRLTRHPNCFGDFCVWWGIFLVACDGGWRAAAVSVSVSVSVSVVSPLTTSALPIHGSGKRLLERHRADRPDLGRPARLGHVRGTHQRLLAPVPRATAATAPGPVNPVVGGTQ